MRRKLHMALNVFIQCTHPVRTALSNHAVRYSVLTAWRSGRVEMRRLKEGESEKMSAISEIDQFDKCGTSWPVRSATDEEIEHCEDSAQGC